MNLFGRILNFISRKVSMDFQYLSYLCKFNYFVDSLCNASDGEVCKKLQTLGLDAKLFSQAHWHKLEFTNYASGRYFYLKKSNSNIFPWFGICCEYEASIEFWLYLDSKQYGCAKLKSYIKNIEGDVNVLNKGYEVSFCTNQTDGDYLRIKIGGDNMGKMNCFNRAGIIREFFLDIITILEQYI